MPTELQAPLWEWWIVAYFFLGGVAGGAYFLSTIIELVGSPEDRPAARMGYYIAFPLAIVCAILLIVDLGRPDRFWHMMVYSRNFLPWINWISPMSVGAIALLMFGLFSFLSFLDALVETGRLPWATLRERYSGKSRIVYSVIGAIFGFFLTAYTGELLSTSQMPIWTGSPLLGALFAASGATTGMAAVALGLVISRARLGFTWQKLRQTELIAMVVEFILLVIFLVFLGSTALPLLTGLTGVLLIGGVIILGLLVPFALYLWIGRAGDRHSGLVIAIAILTLLGGLLFRTAIVMGGQGLL
jgi:formate-dependent nitrite reductase membrane component NrfD